LEFNLPAHTGVIAKDVYVICCGVHVELGTTLRHIYWNVLAHLRAVQRLKMRQELSLVRDLPREGYLTLTDFYD
jgi:hypothetical protein